MRGVYEYPVGSKMFWIHWQHDGKRHREKVGSKGAAQKLYQKRKIEAQEGKKLPELVNRRSVTVGDLIDLAVEFTADHKDRRSYVTKAKIVRDAMGAESAAQVTPQDIDRWLTSRAMSPATSNRYKSFISLCYREGWRNGKVSVNPARLVRQRKEPTGRKRFLSRTEFDRVLSILQNKSNENAAAFTISVYTGMRLTEQFTVTWAQVHPDRKTIELSETKNGSARTVRLGKEALAAIESLKLPGQKAKDLLFPAAKGSDAYGTRSWFGEALKDAEISEYTWHNNRHTFCSWLAMAGASIKDIQELAGHKTISMSARYAHLSPEHSLSVLDRLGQAAT
jgi:integrase